MMTLYFEIDHTIASEGFSANYISLDASKGNMSVCSLSKIKCFQLSL